MLELLNDIMNAPNPGFVFCGECRRPVLCAGAPDRPDALIWVGCPRCGPEALPSLLGQQVN